MKSITRDVRPRRSAARVGASLLAVLLLTAAGCMTSNPELRHRGNVAYHNGDYVRAESLYAKAVEQRPQDFEAQYGLGRVYLALGEPRKGQHALEAARVLVEDRPELREQVLDALAQSLYEQERYDRLHAFVKDAADQYGTPRDYQRQAEYLMEMGDVDGAEVAYRKAAYFAAPDDVEPYLALASFYDSIEAVSRAEQALRWALYVEPDNQEVAERLRDHEVVPGPTVAERPPKSDFVE